MVRILKNKPLKPFHYRDKGSLATVGRHLAVADLPFGKFKGYFAWILWSIVHLLSIIGVKNKIFILLDWTWKYITYDQALRLLIKAQSENVKMWKCGNVEIMLDYFFSPIAFF